MSQWTKSRGVTIQMKPFWQKYFIKALNFQSKMIPGACLKFCFLLNLSVLYLFPTGWFGEITGNYRNLFFLAGAPTILGAFIFSLVHCIKDPVISRQQKRAIVIPNHEKEIMLVYERLTVV